MGALCHPTGTPSGAPSPVERRRSIAAGERLYAAGTPRTSIYAVRAGFLEVMTPEWGGARHVVRFLLPGDVGGLAAFAEGSHELEAVALQDSQVCEIPAYRVEMLSQYDHRLASHLRRLLAREVAQAQGQAVALSRYTAEQRVARFLLGLSQRWAERGFSATSFSLPMGRREIGDHLGLTMETVSRILCAFSSRGWIALPRGRVEILAADKLGDLLPEATRLRT